MAATQTQLSQQWRRRLPPHERMVRSRHLRWRRLVHLILDRDSSYKRTAAAVEYFLVGLILIDVLAVVLESVPSIAARYEPVLYAIEITSVVVFTVEYALRLWTAPEQGMLNRNGPWHARFKYALTPIAIVDLIAIAPVYLVLVGESSFTVILLVRLARFFKLARYSPGMRTLVEVVYTEWRALLACLIIIAGLALLMATAMHLAEAEAQPAKFGTIPDALWWAVVTLTTVGYGDAVPITAVGKVVASITALAGLVMLALPVGIIATAFAQTIHKREFVITWSMLARVPAFGGLDAAEIAEIAEYLRARSVPAQAVIMRRGDPADALFFIAEGEVEIRGHYSHRRLTAGEFFGEMSIINGQPRSATVRAVVPTKLLMLDAEDLRDLMRRHPELERRMIESARRKALEGEAEEVAAAVPQHDEGRSAS